MNDIMNDIMRVELYTTLGCHLCEDADALLTQLISEGLDIVVTPIEIADSPELIEKYGIRIPVVRVDDRELGWPFNLEALRQFVKD